MLFTRASYQAPLFVRTYTLEFVFIFNMLSYEARGLHRFLHLAIVWLLKRRTYVTATIRTQIVDSRTKKFFVAAI